MRLIHVGDSKLLTAEIDRLSQLLHATLTVEEWTINLADAVSLQAAMDRVPSSILFWDIDASPLRYIVSCCSGNGGRILVRMPKDSFELLSGQNLK